MIQVVLGLGSNSSFEGKKPVELLAQACRKLSLFLSDMVISTVYESKAMYVLDQENFYNLCVKGFVSDDTTPEELLKKINQIEAELGRNRSKEIRFGPRSLDIDIEEFGSVELNSESLILPHPRMQERAFVLIPMLEIFSKYAEENKRREIIGFLSKLGQQEIVRASVELQRVFNENLK